MDQVAHKRSCCAGPLGALRLALRPLWFTKVALSKIPPAMADSTDGMAVAKAPDSRARSSMTLEFPYLLLCCPAEGGGGGIPGGQKQAQSVSQQRPNSVWNEQNVELCFLGALLVKFSCCFNAQKRAFWP